MRTHRRVTWLAKLVLAAHAWALLAHAAGPEPRPIARIPAVTRTAPVANVAAPARADVRGARQLDAPPTAPVPRAVSVGARGGEPAALRPEDAAAFLARYPDPMAALAAEPTFATFEAANELFRQAKIVGAAPWKLPRFNQPGYANSIRGLGGAPRYGGPSLFSHATKELGGPPEFVAQHLPEILRESERGVVKVNGTDVYMRAIFSSSPHAAWGKGLPRPATPEEEREVLAAQSYLEVRADGSLQYRNGGLEKYLLEQHLRVYGAQPMRLYRGERNLDASLFEIVRAMKHGGDVAPLKADVAAYFARIAESYAPTAARARSPLEEGWRARYQAWHDRVEGASDAKELAELLFEYKARAPLFVTPDPSWASLFGSGGPTGAGGSRVTAYELRFDKLTPAAREKLHIGLDNDGGGGVVELALPFSTLDEALETADALTPIGVAQRTPAGVVVIPAAQPAASPR